MNIEGTNACAVAQKARILAVSCRATSQVIGWVSGSIKPDLGIVLGDDGGALLNPRGTLYPNIEVWEYGPDGPRLLLDFATPGSEPIRGLSVEGSYFDTPPLYRPPANFR